MKENMEENRWTAQTFIGSNIKINDKEEKINKIYIYVQRRNESLRIQWLNLTLAILWSMDLFERTNYDTLTCVERKTEMRIMILPYIETLNLVHWCEIFFKQLNLRLDNINYI